MGIRCLQKLGWGALCLVVVVGLTACAESAMPGNYHAANLRMIQAVEGFTTRLSEPQRAALFYAQDDPRLQTGWSHQYVDSHQRNGLALGELDQAQRAAALAVIRTALGEAGYQQLTDVVAADEYLRTYLGMTRDIGQDHYYLAIFGTPAERQPWLLQISGHNYTQHVAFGTDQVAASPAYIGAFPAAFQYDGETVVPMGDKVAAMQILLSGLNEAQSAAAQFRKNYPYVIAGPGQVVPSADEGLPVQYLASSQQGLLLAAVMQWVGGVDADLSYLLRKRYQAELAFSRVGWSGSSDLSQPGAYVRIQGPSLWIELSARIDQQTGMIYYESVYRDKVHDYGR